VQTSRAGIRLCGTAGLEHALTPFGYEIGVRALAGTQSAGIVAVLKAYVNEQMVLPGIDCAIIKMPIFKNARQLFWSPRVALWLQPKDQQFYTREVTAGVLAENQISIGLTKHFNAFASLELKTQGWVAGIEDLDRAAQVSIGGEWSL
jgi:hypothetical protein